MFADQIQCYEAIAQALINEIPRPWTHVKVAVELDGTSVEYQIDFWTPDHTDAKEFGYVPGLGNCFYELARLVSTEDKGYYKKCIFVLYENGKYNTDFTY